MKKRLLNARVLAIKVLGKLFKNIGLVVKLAVVGVVSFISLAIAFPHFSYTSNAGEYKTFDGIDLNDLTNQQVNFDFKFTNSLDFYGGSRVTYKLNSGRPEEYYKRILGRFNRIIRNSGITDYTLQLKREQQGEALSTYYIIAELPKTQLELANFNGLLASLGSFSFIKQSQPEAPEGSTEPQTPLNVPTALEPTDISSVGIVYGAETFGYGLVIDFNQEAFAQLVYTAVSDLNTEGSNQLFLALDNQPIAGQAVAVNSTSGNPRVVFATQLGNDGLAANLLRELIMNQDFSDRMDLEGQVVTIPGRFDSFSSALKVAIVALIGILFVVMLTRNRLTGAIVWFNIALLGTLSVAVMKLGTLPLSIALLSGLAVGMLLWARHFRAILPIWQRRNLNYYKAIEVLQPLRRKFTVVSGIMLLASALLRFFGLVFASEFFGTIALVCVVGTVLSYSVTSTTLRLLKTKS